MTTVTDIKPSATLVLKYQDVFRPTFFFGYRNDNSSNPLKDIIIDEMSFYVEGPVGSKKRFVVVKEYYRDKRNLEVGDTQEEAIQIAYIEVVNFINVLLRDFHFLHPGKHIDDTGRKKESKLEREFVKPWRTAELSGI